MYRRMIGMLVLGVLALLGTGTVHAQDASPPPDRSVVGQSTIEEATFRAVLAEAQSPMAEHAQALYRACGQANVDCGFVLAIARKESQYGRALAAPYNWGNVKCFGYTRCTDQWRVYHSWDDATADWLAMLRDVYLDAGDTTVATIIPRYAPASDNNDPDSYVADVVRFMAEWEAGAVAPEQPQRGGGVIQEATATYDLSVYAYHIEETWWWWRINHTILSAADALHWFSMLFPSTIAPILDLFGENGAALMLAILAVAAAVGGLLLALRPFGIRHDVIGLRGVPALAIAATTFIPIAGTAFVQMDDAFRQATDALYDNVFRAGRDILAGDAPLPEDGTALSEVTQFRPWIRGGRHGFDLVTTYLGVAESDFATDTLPLGFSQTFVRYDMVTFEKLPPAERQSAIGQLMRGKWRMTAGVVLSLFALGEYGLSALVMCTLLGGWIALVWALLLAVASPMLHLADRMARHLLRLVGWSIAVVGVHAVATAWLFHTATTASVGTLVGTAAVFALVDFLVVLPRVVRGVSAVVVQGVRDIAGRDGLPNRGSLLDVVGQRIATPAAAVGAAVVSPAAAGSALLAHATTAAVGYGAAKQAGATNVEALAFVGAANHKVQQRSAMLIAMGAYGPGMQNAVVHGARAARHDSPLASVVAAGHAFKKPAAAKPAPAAAGGGTP